MKKKKTEIKSTKEIQSNRNIPRYPVLMSSISHF